MVISSKPGAIYLVQPPLAFGDLMMCATLIKTINIQYPNMKVFIEMSPHLTPWGYDVLSHMDIAAYGTIAVQPSENVMRFRSRYKPPEGTTRHLVHNLLLNCNESTGLELQYDPEILANYCGPVLSAKVPRPYVLLPAAGKLNGAVSGHKEWGKDFQESRRNFDALALILRRGGMTPVQTGRAGDPILRNVSGRYLGTSMPEFHALVSGAAAIVSLENGLSHYAGHHGKKTYTIYRALHMGYIPEHTHYKGQIALTDMDLTPESLGERIINTYCGRDNIQTVI